MPAPRSCRACSPALPSRRRCRGLARPSSRSRADFGGAEEEGGGRSMTAVRIIAASILAGFGLLARYLP